MKTVELHALLEVTCEVEDNTSSDDLRRALNEVFLRMHVRGDLAINNGVTPAWRLTIRDPNDDH